MNLRFDKIKSKSKKAKKKEKAKGKRQPNKNVSWSADFFLTRNGRVDRIIVWAAGTQVCSHVRCMRTVRGKWKKKRRETEKAKAGGRLIRSNMAFEGPGTCELLHTLK